jgi:glutamate dehydrogenase (NAD(P)+)
VSLSLSERNSPEGISVADHSGVKQRAGTVTAYREGQRLPAAEVLTLPCDILVPGARPDSFHAGNAGAIQAKLIFQDASWTCGQA